MIAVAVRPVFGDTINDLQRAKYNGILKRIIKPCPYDLPPDSEITVTGYDENGLLRNSKCRGAVLQRGVNQTMLHYSASTVPGMSGGPV